MKETKASTKKTLGERFVLNVLKKESFSDIYPYDEAEQSVGSKLVEIELVPEGEWTDADGEKFEFTLEDLQELEQNFDIRSHNGEGLPITIGHPIIREDGMREELPSMGWIRRVYIGMGEAGKMVLKGLTEWTQDGLWNLQSEAYKFLSPEIAIGHVDQQTGKNVGLVLLTAALTNFPFFKELATVRFSEGEGTQLVILKGGEPTMDEDQNKDQEAEDVDETDETDAEDQDTDLEPKEDETDAEAEDADADESDSKDEGEVTLKASEVNSLRKAAKLGKEAHKKLRAAEIQKDVDSLIYSEGNPKGVLKNAQKDQAMKFAAKLSDNERAEFMKLMTGLPSLGNLFSEQGQGGDNDGESKTAPKGVDEESYQLSEKIKARAKAENVSYSEAMDMVAEDERKAKFGY